MKKIIITLIALGGLALADPPAESYTMRSSVFGSSSATTSGMNYQMQSTVGEPISASSSTSTNYSIKSGFWYTLQALEAPSLTNPLAFETGGNSSSFSIEASANGSSSTIGFEYGEATGVYTQTFSTANGDLVNGDPLAGGSATITGNIDGLDAETTYFIRAYGFNSSGSSTSTEISFTTLSPEPIGHSSFSQIGEGLNSITFTHDRADEASIEAEGYLIIRKTTAFKNNDYPEDGSAYSLNEQIGDAVVVSIITDATSTLTILNNQTAERSWNFALVPYNTSNDDTSTNYLIANAPTIQGYTIPTLGEWGMIAFGGLMLVFGAWWVRRV